MLLIEPGHLGTTHVLEALTDAGSRVDSASDGEKALVRVRTRAYDVVICDLDVSGFGSRRMIYRAMATTTPALARRVVFVTEDTTDADTERFLLESG